MTKKRTAVSSPSATKTSHPKSYRERILARVYAAKKHLGKALAVLALLTMVGEYAYSHKLENSIKISALYLFANDGIVSGRMSGDVKMKNGRSRRWVNPTLIQNDATSTVRTDFGVLSSNWNALTDGQRKSWNVIGGYTFVDRMGRTKILAGKQLFVALNRALFTVGQAQISTAPVTRSVVGPATLSVAVDDSATSMILTFTATPVPALTSWVVYATAPQSPGTFNPSPSKYRIITVLPAATATGADVYDEYALKFGAPPIGTKVFIKIVAASTVSGGQSAGHVAFSIVVA